MRQVMKQYLDKSISRRTFVRKMMTAGISLASAHTILRGLEPLTNVQALPEVARRKVIGTGGELLAEQLMASGVTFIFGNSGSGDAGFYEALVDRPQLRYILGLHEGPLAAMAAGYAKVSREPAYLCVSGIAGMTNILGHMYNAHKERTSLVCVAYKREGHAVSGRDVFEELAGQEDLAAPISKWQWIATGAGTIPEIVRRAFKIANTPPFGPVYIGWHSDLLLESGLEAEIVPQSAYNVPMALRPSQKDVERAAKMLVEAPSPVLLVGDELYKAGAIAEAVRLTELLAIPVATTPYEGFSNFPEAHPLYLGIYSAHMRFPRTQDLVVNVGSRVEILASSRQPYLPPETAFIDIRIDSREVAAVFPTAVPLVCNVKEGLTDLIMAVEGMLTPSLKAKFQERFEATRAFTAAVRRSQMETVVRSAAWNGRPILPARLSYEISRVLDKDAFVIVESVDPFGFDFDPLAGQTYVASRGGHLGFGVGGAAGVKMARPHHQVVCLVGDGSFLFGPHALWTMARAEIPVIIIVFNNQSYNSVKDRTLAMLPNGRMRQTGHLVHNYIGSPDVDAVRIAEGFGVKGERIMAPTEIEPAVRRAINATREGRPYLIDAHVARMGMWADSPWYPPISIAKERQREV
ncbi:MAG: thiamine pyrophosphate-binding protein [Acidobacteria bacterium]|nr:thiamine pyrophosphate-binding protein [Acidobacteriota bacterium]